MLNIPALEPTSKKGMVSGVEVKRWVRFVVVKFKPEPSRTHEKVVHAVNSVLGSSASLRDLSNNLPVSEGDIVKEDIAREFLELMSMDDDHQSALPCLKERC